VKIVSDFGTRLNEGINVVGSKVVTILSAAASGVVSIFFPKRRTAAVYVSPRYGRHGSARRAPRRKQGGGLRRVVYWVGGGLKKAGDILRR